MEYVIFKICLASACFSLVWVDLLTAPRGLLDFIPKYYPNSLAEKPLRCSHCFSGWLAVFMWLVYLLVNFSMNIDFYIDPMQAFVYTLFAPCFSMYLIALIKR